MAPEKLSIVLFDLGRLQNNHETFRAMQCVPRLHKQLLTMCCRVQNFRPWAADGIYLAQKIKLHEHAVDFFFKHYKGNQIFEKNFFCPVTKKFWSIIVLAQNHLAPTR